MKETRGIFDHFCCFRKEVRSNCKERGQDKY
jgi:hypothetical protein